MLNVVGIFVAVIFCAGVYACAVTDQHSGNLSVNCGRALVIRPLIWLLEEFDC